MSTKRAILSATIAVILIFSSLARAEIVTDDKDHYQDDETGLYFFETQGNRWGIMTKDFVQILEPILSNYDDCFRYYFSEGLAAVCDLNGLWGYVDAAGEIAIPFQFDDADAFTEGRAAVMIDDMWGYIDQTGALICDPVYNRAWSFQEGLARVESNTGYGFVDASGTLAIEAKYDWVTDFKDGYAVFGLDHRYGCIDTVGNVAIEPLYDDMGLFSDGLAVVCLGNLYGYIDSTGVIAIPLAYNYAMSFENGLAVVETDDTQLLIDATGKALISFPGDVDVTINSADEVYVTSEHTKLIAYYYRVDNEFQLATEIGSSFDMTEYYPNEGEKVATQNVPAAPPDWAYGASLPKIDGATALFPVYSALVQATYPASTRYGDLITCSKTDGAYEKLISGDADVIFVAGPSDAQLEMAAEAGVAFDLTPIGKEAFVFIVNTENPLNEIALDEIRGVYSGQITQWDALGVEGLGDIVAYQRPENSGSQTALERLMEGYVLMEAPAEWIGDGMDSTVQLVEYRNLPNAIGYSFRFYVTDLMNSDVTLLAIDGVAPTVENIRNESYPLTTQLYAVSRKNEENPNVAVFLDWVRSDDGMELIEASGYVPER